MKPQERSIRERCANVEFEVRKQEIRVLDCQDAFEERKKQKELSSVWSPDNQFYLEDLEFQLTMDKLLLAKLVHHLQFLQAELERAK